MNITVIGAGNSGLAMAAHLISAGNKITLWNRSKQNIKKLISTKTIHCYGVINCDAKLDLVTDDMEQALADPDLILITTPANSHKEIAILIAKYLKKETLIVLNPGRTFGALEFEAVYYEHNKRLKQTIAETQTIIYTCRKVSEDSVNLISFKANVSISVLDASLNKKLVNSLPDCLKDYLLPARSMIETSIGNVGMILHCAPLILNTGWTENEGNLYKYYYDGITPTIVGLIEKLDLERISVSRELGLEIESTKEWMERSYNVEGEDLYQCIQNNEAYRTIDAPTSLDHRYIFEDIPCGLVPLEAAGYKLGLDMKYTKLIIDLASSLMAINFRKAGRNLDYICNSISNDDFRNLFKRSND